MIYFSIYCKNKLQHVYFSYYFLTICCCIVFPIATLIMKEHDPQYNPNLRGEDVYNDVYEHEPEFRVWNNTMYEIPPQGLLQWLPTPQP